MIPRPTRRRQVRSHGGYMALVSVIILGVVGTVMGLSVALRGISELDRGLATIQEHKLIAIADACAEDVLWQYSRNPGTPVSPVSINGGTCVISTNNLGGGDRGVTVVATLERWTRTLSLRVDTGTDPVTLYEWRVVH